MKKIILPTFLATLLLACNQKMSPEKEFSKSVFTAVDHTGENLFSRNIEGPAVDKKRKTLRREFPEGWYNWPCQS